MTPANFEALIGAVITALVGIGYIAGKIRKVAAFIDFAARLPAEHLLMQKTVEDNTTAIKALSAQLEALTDVEARRTARRP